MQLPSSVTLIEVGPRDGLQNEKSLISTEHKVEFISLLKQSGFKRLEVTSYVSPKHVPQMADASEVYSRIEQTSVQNMVLVPNKKGYDRAVKDGVDAINFVMAASETFNERNVRMSMQNSLEVFDELLKDAKERGLFVRLSIATSFWCPFEGRVDEDSVLRLLEKYEGAVDEIAICDTIGKANPLQVYELFEKAMKSKGKGTSLVAHFHDTYGLGQANVLAALEAGVTHFDSAAGGLGGCPFAPGAAGNIATEDLVFMLEEMGINTEINIGNLLEAVSYIKEYTERSLTGHLHSVFKNQGEKING